MDKKAFGRRIKEARERLRLSQEDVAEKVGKTQHTISQYETGKHLISIGELERLADALEVSVGYFFTGTITTDNLDQLALEQFQRLSSAEAKQALLTIMRVFCDTVATVDTKPTK